MGKTKTRSLAGRPIAYYARIAVICNSAKAALVLCQLIYWSGRGESRTWTYKTDRDLAHECALTRHEFATAKKILREKEFVTVHLHHWPRRTYYRVNWKIIERALQDVIDRELLL